MFKINLRKENTYITGLSMGGYGALKSSSFKTKSNITGLLLFQEF